MEKKVVVHNGVHATVREQHVDMLVEFFTHHEGMMEFIHQSLFVFSKRIGIVGVDSRETAGFHLIFLAVHNVNLALEINVLQYTTVDHLPFGMFAEQLSFHLELKHGNGLVHLCCQTSTLGIHFFCATAHFRNENRTRIVFVCLHRECGQRNQINAIAFLDGCKIGIAE